MAAAFCMAMYGACSLEVAIYGLHCWGGHLWFLLSGWLCLAPDFWVDLCGSCFWVAIDGSFSLGGAL